LVNRLRESSADGFLIPGLLTTGHDDKRGTLLGKRLAYWVRKKAGLSDPALVAYAFRRTVVTQMEAAGVPLYVRQQVAGHKAMNVTEASYTDPASVARRLEAIAHVTYGSEVDGLVEAAGGTLVVKKVARRRAKVVA
jgi:integrase